MTEENVVRVHCNRCGHETKHAILATHQTEGSAEVEGVGHIWWTDSYEFLECGGCEAVTLRNSHWFSDTDETTVHHYPPRASRSLPRWKSKLPWQISSLLGEAYLALHADSRRLAVMGARAILDMLFLDTIGDKGTFKDKLKALESQGFVGSKNREYLEAALDAGSAAMHRGHVPSAEAVGHVMDIVENLLQAVYVLRPAASALKTGTPPRR